MNCDRWRAKLLLPVIRFWGQVLLWLGFFMVPSVTGREHLEEAKKTRALLVFNHVSYLDAILICSLFSPSGLAKVEPVSEVAAIDEIVFSDSCCIHQCICREPTNHVSEVSSKLIN